MSHSEHGMNEGAVQWPVASAHLVATEPPLCQLLLCSLPCSLLSAWASTRFLWRSEFYMENQERLSTYCL